jgi:acyl-CoA synthetase (AMP-forming)/AMP-acid ligase II
LELLAEPFGDAAALIRLHAQAAPEQRALVCGDAALTYRQLDTLMDRIAAGLQRDGVAPRQAIAICAGASIEYLAVFLGALRAGVAVAPISPSLTPVAIGAMVEDCDAKVVFVDTSTLTPALTQARGRVVVFDAEPSLESWLPAEGTRPSVIAVEPDWPFNIIYSSGTTGAPKGIVQPHLMRWLHMQRGPAHGYDAQAITLVSTPLYSNTTLVAVFPTLATGGTLVLMPRFDAAGYLALAQRVHASHTMLVPVQYRRIMALPDFDRYDLSAFRAKFSTSAPFAAALKRDILARWPGALTEFYGMTEGGGTCVLQAHLHPDKLHTVGLRAPGHDIRLIDEEGRELAPGETGEVVGHSPAMMSAYHRRADATAEAEWWADGKRFIRTGDVGRFDEDGFLTLVDRRKDMIISGGFNVYPGDLESVLAEHAAVAEAAVIGVPSEQWGETPLAFVVLRDGARASADEIRDWANARLGKMQRISAVRLLDALPRSPIGKVLKRELRELQH